MPFALFILGISHIFLSLTLETLFDQGCDALEDCSNARQNLKFLKNNQ